jgi:hypothetical protein
MNYNVYVDYNDNGAFTDPGELVLQMGSSIPGTSSGSFTIPAIAPPGIHRMRIRAELSDEFYGGGYPTDPCTQLQYGETEDYGLTVTVPCTPPTIQAIIGSYTNNTTGDSVTVNWTRGNGDNVLIVGRLTSSTLSNPVSGTSYTANNTFGSGTQVSTGNFVVYNGAGTSVTVSGLTSLTSYSFTCYEYNTTETCYKTPGSASALIAGIYCRPPQSVNYNCCGRYISNVTTTAGISNFTNTTGAETASYGNYSSTKIASQAQGSPVNIFATHPSSGMDYIVYVDYNDNGVFTDAGELVLQIGNGVGGTVAGSFTIPGNAPLGTHRMRVRGEESSYGYPFGPCTQLQIGETEDYGLTVTAPTGEYCIPALSKLYNYGLHVSNVTTTAGITNFTNATGIEASSYGNYSSDKIASQAQNSPITISATSPGSGMYYNVYVDYNDNRVFTDPGELVLQMERTTAGTISGSFTIPADAPPGTHRMRLRGEYFSIGYPTGPCARLEYGETEDYGLTVTVGCTPPTTQATIGSYTNNGLNASGITVNWTRGNGSNILVVGRPTSSALTDPSSGTSYTSNTIFGSGTQIGTGNFVVYNGTGTSVAVSGLSAGTSYTFSCYEYENTGICYKNPGSALAVVPGLYCKPPSSAWDNGKYISNVTTTGGVTNFTNTTVVETASYGNYSSAQIASQTQGSPITILATSTVSGTDYIVYVDYNDNGVFTDPGELVLGMATASPGTVSGSFTIPADAPLGTHRMRVRSEAYSAGYPTGPCTQLQYGETEDYGLTVTTECSVTATITAGGSTTFCQGGSVMLTSSPGDSYLWSTGATTQSITVSAAGDYTVNVTSANGCSATSTVTAVTVNQPETWYLDADNDGYYVSSQSSCGSPGAGYSQTATTLGDCDDSDNTNWQSATLYIDTDNDNYDNGTATICYGTTIPSGYKASTLGADCNDNNVAVHESLTWYLDTDNDGHYVSSQSSCGSPGAGYNQTATTLGDCNDNDSNKWRSASLYIDNDNDNYNNGSAVVCYGATPPSGYKTSTLGSDCNDNDPSIHDPVQYFIDADQDGYGSTISAIFCSSIAPGGYSTNNLDCNDHDPDVHTAVQYYVDADHDGFGSATTAMLCSSTPPDGYSANSTDCNDNNASIHVFSTWYLDADNDGHYVNSQSSCGSPGAGYNQTATTWGDCDDGDNTKWQSATLYRDNDNDNYDNGTATVCYGATIPPGYKTATSGHDCNDNNAAVHPGAAEICGNGIDDNCNGTIDEGCVVTYIYYADGDKDGYGRTNSPITSNSAVPPKGYARLSGDCNDTKGSVHPGATEICNGIDDNCDGGIDEGVSQTYYRDADGDGYGNPAISTVSCSKPKGYVTNNTDCDDTRSSVHPGAAEVCDGLDNNCNGTIDEGTVMTTWYRDADGDGYGNPLLPLQACAKPVGYVTNSTDCNDASASVHPGAAEVCGNGIDDNCNGQVDENCGGGATCSNATNLTTTNITATTATLNWVAAVNPVEWRVQYMSTARGSKWKNVSPTPIPSARSVTVSGLLAGQTYNWRIAAKCGKNFSSYLDASSFKTLTSLARSTNVGSQPLEAVEKSAAALKLYPNPSNGQFMVDLQIGERINATARLQLIDITGRIVYSQSANVNNGVLQKKVLISSMLSSGIYTVEIIANGKSYFSKLMYAK